MRVSDLERKAKAKKKVRIFRRVRRWLGIEPKHPPSNTPKQNYSDWLWGKRR